jgi:hypothetical protein
MMKKRLSPEEFVKLAREIPRDERTPFAFEKRIMAHITMGTAPDALSLWSRALWRAVAPCLGIMLVVAAISFTHTNETSADAELDLDSAVLAPPDVVFDLSA